MNKQKELKKLYKELKPYVKLELVRHYMSTLYGVQIQISYISKLIEGHKDNAQRIEEVYSVLLFVKRLLNSEKKKK